MCSNISLLELFILAADKHCIDICRMLNIHFFLPGNKKSQFQYRNMVELIYSQFKKAVWAQYLCVVNLNFPWNLILQNFFWSKHSYVYERWSGCDLIQRLLKYTQKFTVTPVGSGKGVTRPYFQRVFNLQRLQTYLYSAEL